MPPSGMLCHVPLGRTDVSKELVASIIRGTSYTVCKLLVTANVVLSSSIFVTLMMEAILSPETSVLTRATRRHIQGEGILHSDFRENLKSYIALPGWTFQRRCNVSPVKYELGFYIPEDDILHSHIMTDKRQTRPLVREGARTRQDRNCQTVNYYVWGSTPRHTD
jgi:hypothetical protein